ncbi:MAG: hypothetical protein ACK4NX_03515, partial [Candidatus Paceibacteria bacterium]
MESLSKSQKKEKRRNTKLLHIVDLDAKKALTTNFDVYDKLTYFINIEVDGISNSKFMEKLLEINARVVVELPTAINLKKW